MRKKVIIPSLVLGAIACSGLYAVNSTFASENQNGRDTIVQKIAEKFNLNSDEVQTVFEENREARQAQNQERQDERLAQAVSEGKLSQEQKQLILDKTAELRSEREDNREAFQNMTQEERKAQRELHREEMDSWFEANGIDHQYLGGSQGQMRGGQRGGGFGNK